MNNDNWVGVARSIVSSAAEKPSKMKTCDVWGKWQHGGFGWS